MPDERLVKEYITAMEKRFEDELKSVGEKVEAEMRVFRRKVDQGEFEVGGDPLASITRLP